MNYIPFIGKKNRKCKEFEVALNELLALGLDRISKVKVYSNEEVLSKAKVYSFKELQTANN